MMSKTNEIKQVFDEVFLEYCPEGDARNIVGHI